VAKSEPFVDGPSTLAQTERVVDPVLVRRQHFSVEFFPQFSIFASVFSYVDGQVLFSGKAVGAGPQSAAATSL